jgi:alpha-tubulin suppressor-like RCC1 family protein
MRILRRSRWLALLAGCTALTAGMAGAAAGPAQARVQPAGAVFQSHVAAAWGANENGQLGDGTSVARSLFVNINAGNQVAQVSAGLDHGLAVSSDGSVWAWGANDAGQLGDGVTIPRNTPAHVPGLTGVFTQVAAGLKFSLALRSDGTVWAWGDNRLGELGRGTTGGPEVTPARVAVLNHVTRIAAGGGFALALRSDGIVFAWGGNGTGQLGTGTTDPSPTPVKIAGLSQVTGIAAGLDSAAAIEASNVSAVTSVWTWGANMFGQLGDGTLVAHLTPERVSGVPASVAGVSVGGQFTVILATDGSVWGWGINNVGQLALAAGKTPVTRPVNVIAAGSHITQLSAGGGHVLALRSDGTVLGWGFNKFGELGNGTSARNSGPVQVTGLTSATQVSAGFLSSLAVHIVPFLVGS